MENSTNSKGDRRPTPSDRQSDFTLDALDTVLRRQLCLSPDSLLYVAFSGGMDSHVLLHAVAGLRRTAPWRVAALHIDHGLQPESARWSRHCADVCTALGVAYQSQRVDVRDVADRGIEDAARRARYRALARLLPAGAVLLTAHHRTDQAETLLLQLLRGAGVPGLAAMPAITAFARGRLARPLLGFERGALARYAAAHALRWIEDASNRDIGPARNFLRHRVWPILTERWPAAAERLATSAGHLAEAGELLDELARLDMAESGDADEGLRVSALQALSRPRRSNLLRYWIRARGVAAPPEPVLREILARVEHTPRTRHAAVRYADVEVRRYRDRLLLRRPLGAIRADWEVPWDPPAGLEIPGAGWELHAHSAVGAGISCARLADRMVRVRLRRGGEYCRLGGHRRQVKKLFQEAGIPPWERAYWPLIFVDGELAAIGDRWVCEPYAARDDEAGWVLQLRR